MMESRSISLRNYKPLQLIGEGSTAVVYAAMNKSTAKKYAIKCIKFSHYKKRAQQIKNEVDILKSIDHPNVIALHDYFKDPQHQYLVMDYVENGDLMDDLQVQKRYSEEFAKNVASDFIQAIDYCHQRGIVHRDLKPENILIDKFGSAKIADFGLAKRIERSDSLNTYCGTLLYMAPEMICGYAYNKSIDVWSAGLIIFIMLGGYHPFQSESDTISKKMIRKGSLYFHPPYWKNKSTEAIDLIQNMVCVCPLQRMTANEALKSSWLHIDQKNNFQQSSSWNPLRCFTEKMASQILNKNGYNLKSIEQ